MVPLGNYIKIDRKILEWEWWSDINTYRLFTYMLIRANWKDGRFKGIEIPRGSFVSSISKLSEETNLTVNEVRTALSHLKSTGEITSIPHSRFTVFSINNYRAYQGNSESAKTESQSDHKQITNRPQADNKQTTSKPQPINEQLTTIEEKKEGEEEKEGKNKIITPLYPPAGERGAEAEQRPKKRETQGEILDRLLLEIPVSDYLLEHIKEWLEYKKERRFTYKERGLKTLIRQASESAEKYGEKAVASAISDSIASGYQGIVWEKAKRAGQEGGCDDKRLDNESPKNIEPPGYPKGYWQ